MKRISSKAVKCLLLFATGITAWSVMGGLEHETAKAFYDECLRFDYCGTNGNVRTDRGESHEKVLQLMVMHQPEVVQRDKDFYDVLARFEVSTLTGSGGRHVARLEVGRWLMAFKKQEKKIELWNYVSSVEYSLLRILACGIDKISMKEIDDVLPEELYELKTRRSEDSRKDATHKAFKNMIAIAWELGEWEREHGSFPPGLQELTIDDKWLRGIYGADIEYEMKDGIWQLFSPGAPGGKNRSKFNEYVPVMDVPGVRFWPEASCLWLSSDYSEKRLRLYEHGKLYDSSSPCACKLERGGIYRQ